MNLTMRRCAKVALAVLTLLVLLSQSALAASISCYVNADTKIYNSPSTSASRSMTVSKNLSVKMTGIKGSWALITRAGVNAFIPLKYLTLDNLITAYAAQDTAMYKNASSSSTKLGTVPMGTKLYISGRDGSYFRVQNKEGSITGYIRGSHLSSKPPKTQSETVVDTPKPTYSPSMSDSDKLDYLVYYAKQLDGRPYSSSPNPPSSFDCSRFVKYCYAAIGVSLSGSAKEQGYDDGMTKITSISGLKTGDIVCFNTNTSDDDLCDHTGIYIGDGYFIHASSSSGRVLVSTLSSGYYKRAFSWARRVLD